MRKIALMVLSLLVITAFSLPVMAQDEAPAMAGEQEEMGPGPDAMSGMAEPGRKCGPSCRMDGMKGMKGMKGMMGMSGGMDRMSRPPMDKSCRMPQFYLMNRDALGLSDSQTEALEKLNSALRKEMILKGASIKVLEMELSDIVTKVDFKLDDALAKLGEIEKARTVLRSSVLKASSDARDVLSTEQRDKLKSMSLSGSMGCCGKSMRPEKGPMKDEMKQEMMEKMRNEMMQ